MSSISISSLFAAPVAALSPLRGEALDPDASPGQVVTEPSATRAGPQAARTTRDDPAARDGPAFRDAVQLSEDALDRLSREDPALEQRIRAEAAAALVRARALAAAGDSPVDQAAFRAEVIDYLKAIYISDPAFARALARGTIVVRPVAADESPQMQPEAVQAVYRTGAMGAGPQPGEGVDKNDFVAWWPR